MTTLEALEVLLSALEEMAGIMYEQARIIEEHKAVDEEAGRQLAARRANVNDLITKVEEEGIGRCILPLTAS